MNREKDGVLYIDDEIENLQGFAHVFRKYYKIHTAISAKEGFDILCKNPVKVVITDHRMPEMTGIEFLKKILKKYPDVIRIIVTAYSDIDTVLQAINEGKVYHFITKPWNVNELKVLIDNAISMYDLKKNNVELIENLKKANTELTIAKEKAEESDRLKSSFITNMTHEIRTPLNSIVGFTTLLLNDNLLDQTTKEKFIRTVENNTANLLDIIEDLLDASKIDAGSLTLNESEFDVNSLLQDLVNEYQKEDSLKEKPVKLVLNNNEQKELKISADKVRTRQILSYLVDNAIKFTDSGTVEIGYTITSGKSKKIEFYVKDTGIGIPKDKFDQIFERFRKIENERNRLFRGNGLGLFIAKKLAELMSGEISLQSKVDKGSTFFATIPYKTKINGNGKKERLL